MSQTVPPKTSTARTWSTSKSLIPVIIFIVLAALAEYLIVLYSMDLGVADPTFLRISWPVAFVISPLFQIVPIAVIVTLGFLWMYLSKKLTLKSAIAWRSKTDSYVRRHSLNKNLGKVKARLLKVKAIAYLARPRARVRSAVIVLVTFVVFVFTMSLLAYPQLIFRAVASAYQNIPAFRNFVLSVDNSVAGFAQAVTPIGWIGTAVNNALLSGAPGIGQIGSGLGSITVPLAGLSAADKYLFFQNVGMWVSVLFVIFYAEYMRRGLRRRK